MSDFFTVQNGLVTLQSAAVLPGTATDLLINFVPNELGQLRRRNGTKVLPLDTSLRYYTKTAANVQLLFGVSSTGIKVFETTNYTLLFEISNIYNNVLSEYVFVESDVSGYYSLIVFANNCNPIQVFLSTYTYTHPANTATVQLDLPDFIAIKTFAFSNNVKLNATVSSGISVTLPVSTAARSITLVHYGWSVWVPAQFYFGEEFGRLVVRDDTQVLQVPESLITELPVEGNTVTFPYKEDGTPYVVTQQPRTTDEVAYSEGQTYTYDPDSSLAYSPYFFTFGVATFEHTLTLSVEDVDPYNNKFNYIAHGLVNGTKIQAKLNAPGGITTNTNYYVVNAVADSFQLSSTINGTPINITSTYNTTRQSTTWRSHEIASDGSVSRTLSIGSTPAAYRIYSNSPLPPGLVSGELYWVKDNLGKLEFFTDSNGTVPILLRKFKVLYYKSTDVSTGSNHITIIGHSFFNAQPIAFTYSITPPGPCVLNTVYYVKVLDANTFELFYDVDLTNIIDLDSAGTGGYITESYGPYIMYPEYNEGYLEVQNNLSVLITRMRALDFDGPLRVVVDDVFYSQTINNNGLWSFQIKNSDNTIKPLNQTPAKGDYLSFESLPTKTPQRSALVKIMSTKKGSNMSNSFIVAGTTNYLHYNNQYISAGVVPVYGYQQHFSLTSQPTSGVTAQSRLVLASGTNLLFSSASDSYFRNQYFNNFDISDRLKGTRAEQFQIVLGDKSLIVSIVDYQNSLFVFTKLAVYRIKNFSFDTYEVEKISEHGVEFEEAITEIDSLLYYANYSGVFQIALQAQETYGVVEISNNISNSIRGNLVKFLVFDDFSELVYYVSDKDMFMYSIRAKAWSKLSFSWQHNITQMLLINKQVVMVDKAVNAVHMFYESTDVDLERIYTNQGIDVWDILDHSLRINGAVVLSAIRNTSTNNIVPFAENVYRNNELVPTNLLTFDYRTGIISPEYDECIYSVLYELDGVSNITWNSIRYGYPIPAVFLSAAIRASQFSNNSKVVFVELVFDVNTLRYDNCNIGVVYGNNNKAEIFKNAISTQNRPEGASFVIIKEALQGVAPNYRLLVSANGLGYCVLAGYSFVDKSARSSFISGGS